MRSPVKPRFPRIAGLGFLALFPGFYVYHYLVGRGLIPPVLGGMFGLVALLALPLLVLLHLKWLKRFGSAYSRSGVLWLFYATIVYMVVWTMGHMMAMSSAARPIHMEIFTAMGLWPSLFLIGLMLPMQAMWFRKAALWSWGLLVTLAFLGVNSQYLMVTFDQVDSGTSYQAFGRSVAIASFVAVAYIQSLRWRMGMAIASIAALFVTGARSELYAFIAVYAACEAMLSSRNPWRILMFGAGVAIVGAVVAANLDLLFSSRQLQILDLENSSSWIKREDFNGFALEQIASNPVMGVYGGHWQLGEGEYAHNALSAWVSFGIVGFALYMALNVLSAWAAFKVFWRYPNDPLARAAFLICGSTLLLVVASKAVFWPVPALAWGLAVYVETCARMEPRPVRVNRVQRHSYVRA